MRTLYDLMTSPLTNPYTIDILDAEPGRGRRRWRQSSTLPPSSSVMTLTASCRRTSRRSSPSSPMPPASWRRPWRRSRPAAPVTPDEIRAGGREQCCRAHRARRCPSCRKDHPLVAIAADLRGAENRARCRGDGDEPGADALPAARSSTSCAPRSSAQPVTAADVPPDIARDWRLPDGRARVQVQAEAGTRRPAPG